MEALISHFTFLSDKSLHDKNLDPSTIEYLMRLFELQSYKSWVAMELVLGQEVAEAEKSMQEAEDYLDSTMEEAMEQFRRFEDEMERELNKELQGLLSIEESARKLGKSMEKDANYTSNKYVEAALNSAIESLKSAISRYRPKSYCNKN